MPFWLYAVATTEHIILLLLALLHGGINGDESSQKYPDIPFSGIDPDDVT